jgi:hypothetical protein
VVIPNALVIWVIANSLRRRSARILSRGRGRLGQGSPVPPPRTLPRHPFLALSTENHAAEAPEPRARRPRGTPPPSRSWAHSIRELASSTTPSPRLVCGRNSTALSLSPPPRCGLRALPPRVRVVVSWQRQLMIHQQDQTRECVFGLLPPSAPPPLKRSGPRPSRS